MKRITQSTTGPADVLTLEDVTLPAPGPGELHIRVHAAGINPVDLMVRNGDVPLLGEPPFTIGWDLAGTVLAVGPEVSGFTPGDRVFGMPTFPAPANAYAEEALAAAHELAKTPEALSDAEAGALPLAGLTAWQGLVTHGGLKAGEKVLIHAGAGGVGHLAVQIAKALGAEVWTTVSAAKAEIARDLGADHVIDYKTEDFTDFGPFDLIFDHAGGDQADRGVTALAPSGRLITLLPLSEGAEARAATEGKSVARIMVAPSAADLTELAGLAERGALRPIVAGSFPLAQAPAAHEALMQRPAGKIVLLP
ncbi:NADP-dependent oxidoreductase [Celeribacter neptunius]|uniref:NADPH:quinone reductase n=1 Tax=Celeribacter neptunius TaxID=588602 RepID=A0A1I3J3T7_9RHOB|nr:NADP-dependent oxidoreductase [Celeribacter neptunius]SFI54839.1 NADPH:quinone reductase [Celeribacter neptunius]